MACPIRPVNRAAIVAAAIACAVGPAWTASRPVEIQVEVSEVDHTRAEDLGVEWLQSIGWAERAPRDALKVGSIGRSSPLRADLHFLVQEGAAEMLANPNLVTDSGTTATFNAGGQLPYITSSSLGTSNVEFKPYGVSLRVQPTIAADGRIRLKLKAAVSAPDPTNGTLVSGNQVPALLEREVSTDVTVEPGVTVALAGLVQTHRDETVRGVPVLRRIPLLGALFRWKRTGTRKTTIVVFVTPRHATF